MHAQQTSSISVQIVREPQYSDHSGAGDDNEDLGFPSLSSLGYARILF